MAHSPETKAKVIAALMAGQGVSEIARDYNISKATASAWKSEIPGLSEQNRTQKTRDFGEMLGAYLEELLTTAAVQQVHFRDKEWLNQQSAADLAVLHGVSIDKGIRLFEAAQRAEIEQN